MAEDFDVEAMLEAPVDFGKKDSGLGSLNGGDTSPSTTHQEKNGTKEYSSERDKERKRHKRRSRSRSRDRKKRSKRSRSREKRRRGERGEKGGNRSSSRSPRSRSRSHSRSQSPLPAAAAARNRSRSRSRSRDRAVESRSGRRSRRSNSRDRRDDRGRRQQRSLSRDRYDRRDLYGGGRRGGGGGGGGGYYDRRSPTPREDLPIEERDQRTVFCMQLAARVRQRDIEEFFSKVGRVREVRLIMDNRTRRHKGIAYVEFKAIDSVGKAIAMTGTRLCGVPIVVQHSQAEKNRLAAANASTKTTAAAGSGLSGLLGARNGGVGGGAGAAGGPNGPMSLYVGSLHFNITEDMLRGIFEPFGRVEKIELSRDPETGRSKGYGFVHFSLAEDAKKALEQLNGFELAGRAMKVNYVTEKAGDSGWNNGLHGPGAFDSDEIDRGGIELGAAGRLQLMAKLAEGTDIELPKAAMSALQMSSSSGVAVASSNGGSSTLIPPIATQCFLLTNMFDRHHEASASWPEDIRNDVIEECRNHGGVLHVYVDQTSDEGHVYVKCTSIASATATVNALHGRWFAGRLITAAFVPVIHYHNLFPESAVNTTPLNSVDAGGVSI